MTCRAAVGVTESGIVCAWCEREQNRMSDPEASHGICLRHRDALLRDLNVSIVNAAIAALRSTEYLGRIRRTELADSLAHVVRRIEAT